MSWKTIEEVKLQWYELIACANVGLHRRIESIRHQFKDGKGFNLPGERWDIDIEGSCAEQALAKWLDVYYTGSVNEPKGKDVGDFQVRLSRSSDPYLIVPKHNNPDDIFVLVTGRAPSFTLLGWIEGRDAMKPGWLKSFGNRPAVYAIPPSSLHSMSTLQRNAHVKSRSTK